MVDRVNSSSRIPLPVTRTNVVTVNGGVTHSPKSKIPERLGSKSRPSLIGSPKKTSPMSNNIKPLMYNNGPKSQSRIKVTDENIQLDSRQEKGFEMFLMTGDMMIKTASASKMTKKLSSDSCLETTTAPIIEDDQENVISLASQSESSTDDVRNDIPPHTNGAVIPEHDISDEGIEILNDIRDDSKEGSQDDCSIHTQPVHLVNGDASHVYQTNNDGVSPSHQTNNGLTCEHSPPTNSDGFTSPSDSSGPSADSSPGPTHGSGDYENILNTITVSQSAEKISYTSAVSNPLVRTSKSHENYLQQGGVDVTLIDIDIDDHACSVDQIACHDQSTSSLNHITSSDTAFYSTEGETSKSLQNSPDHRQHGNDRVFMPGFIKFEDTKADIKPSDGPPLTHIFSATDPITSHTDNNTTIGETNALDKSNNVSPETSLNSSDESSDDGVSHSGSIHFEEYNMSELDRIFHQPFKEVDRPAASRLAKRLFNLDGFHKIDVSRHLCKKNDFNYLVAEEYLKYFDFVGLSLVEALRLFLEHFSLIGETQERERVLSHFTKHYMNSNPLNFTSQDACHTLTCAVMLLNTDLHTQNVVRKMTCSEFVENLSGLNDEDDFAKDLLETVYRAIRDERIEWASEDDLSEGSTNGETKKVEVETPRPVVGNNPFLSVPDPQKATEYKKGYVMRKCCLDSDGRRTAFGKRGWKMYYASLRDMILYLFKDEVAYKKDTLVESCTNAIRIHHALASKATDYTKKQHILRLQTADWAEYLFQASDSKELQLWLDTINVVAATLSAPPLPEPVGSATKFQRPLMPSSYTSLNLHQQLQHHEKRVKDLEDRIQEHIQLRPDKGAKSRVYTEYSEKEGCLIFELRRFKSYCLVLSSKMSAYPELEQSETGEMNGVMKTSQKMSKAVQRTLTDRYSYHAAIYKTEHTEYDMV